jgi:hypothetical protein
MFVIQGGGFLLSGGAKEREGVVRLVKWKVRREKFKLLWSGGRDKRLHWPYDDTVCMPHQFCEQFPAYIVPPMVTALAQQCSRAFLDA